MQRMLIASLLVLTALAGCADNDDQPTTEPEPAVGNAITPVAQRFQLPFDTSGPYSYTLESGAFEILPGVGHTLSVAMPLGTGLPNADVHMGLFFPDNGCDWASLMGVDPAPEASLPVMPELTEADLDPCRLPVVTDIGPYYGEELLGDLHATEPGNRLGGFLIENLVPHGYIVAQVSVTGTGDSTGCMDLMGPVEQAGVQEAVRYLGDAAFSNGAVAAIGRSYDGSTPFEAAMAGDLPQLKSIVPISGLYGQLDLMWRNGSVEFRGPGVLWGLYYAFTYTGQEGPVLGGDTDAAVLQGRQIAENLVCTDTQTGAAQAAIAYLYGGDPVPGEVDSYWDERSFKDEVLQNYQGSVYFIHGMQDWNVDPHMAFPFYNELEARGLDVKGLFGQWGHHYPDRLAEHPDNIRWDWAQDLLEWFDHYLKGTGAQPELHVEIEDDANHWRIEEAWPAPDTHWQIIGMDDMTQTSGTGQRIYGVYDPVLGQMAPGASTLTYSLGALSDQDVTISGLPLFHVQVTPDGPGGQVYAELRDATDDRRIAHAIMDLRYADGGQNFQPVIPQTPLTAYMEFFPVDAYLPAGHELELYIASSGRDYMPSAVNTPVTIDASGASELKIPFVVRDAGDWFQPPGWDGIDNRGAMTA
ncbi:MAG: CocE/NonD family hydrolase [Thermoplasmatota archaeon]